MRPVSLRTEDIEKMRLCLGFAGENEHTRITFDARKEFGQYPGAAASLTVCPQDAEPYPAIITRDGDFIIWDITDSDLVHDGDGEYQLSFTQEPHVAKTHIGKMWVRRSLVPTGDIPEGIDDFLTRAGAALTAIPETIFAALAEAKESGEFDGPQGPKGDKGDTGATGPQGPKGDKGDTGATGAQGPQGPKGETGARGPQGPAGADADPTVLIDDTAGTGDTDVTFSADKLTADHSALLNEINDKYEKPSSGIPASDLESGVIPDVSGFYTKPASGIPASDLVPGIVTVSETVSGTTPTITGEANHRYTCGEVATLDVIAPASGCIDVLFTSGSTATVLTITSAKSNTTVKFPSWFDPADLDANSTYEINILDGEWGMVSVWA